MKYLLLILTFFTFAHTVSAEVVVDSTLHPLGNARVQGAPNAVCIDDLNCYAFYRALGTGSAADVEMSTSTDGGATWSLAKNAVDSVNTNDIMQVAIWWEGWTNPSTSTQYIHIATTDDGTDDIYYTRYDITNNTFSTTVVTTTQGATCTAGQTCYPTITMARDGTLYVATTDAQDSWVDACSTTCTSTANWSEITAVDNVLLPLGDDFVYLLPNPSNSNVQLIHRDASLNDVYVYEYSATSSSWVSTTTLNIAAEGNGFYDANLAGVSISTSTETNYLIFSDDVNDYTTEDHDIEFWSYTQSGGWVQGTDAVVDASGGLAGMTVTFDEQNNTLYALYIRQSTIGASSTANVYYRTSTDGGTSWSAESSAVNDTEINIDQIRSNVTSFERIGAWWNYDAGANVDSLMYETVYDIVTSPPAEGGGVIDWGITWF